MPLKPYLDKWTGKKEGQRKGGRNKREGEIKKRKMGAREEKKNWRRKKGRKGSILSQNIEETSKCREILCRGDKVKPAVEWQKEKGQEVVLEKEARARWWRASNTMLQSTDLIRLQGACKGFLMHLGVLGSEFSKGNYNSCTEKIEPMLIQIRILTLIAGRVNISSSVKGNTLKLVKEW